MHDTKGWVAPVRNPIADPARRTFVRGLALGGITAGLGLWRNPAWALDAGRRGVFVPADSLMLRISQPLRVESGGLRLNLPVDYSYDTLIATSGIRTFGLVPTGAWLY